MSLLPLVICACAWALPGQYKKRRKRRKKKKPERVQIHQADLCTGCLSFVEDYQKTLSAIYEAGAMDGRREEDHILPEEIKRAMTARETHYSDEIKQAGRYLRQEALHRVQTSYHLDVESKQQLDEKALVLARKRSLCVDDLEACQPFDVDKPAPADSCEACRALVPDLEFVAKRAGLHTAAGASKTRAWLREALGGVCDDAPFRHPRPLAVETFCVELFDEHEDDVVAAVDSFYAAVRALEIPSLDLEASICVEVAGACAADAVKDPRAAAEL